MTVKQIWMSLETGKKSRFAWHTLGASAGIAALMVLLVCGGTALMFALHLPRTPFLLALCLGVTLLAVWLAVLAGRRAVQDAALFFLTEDGRLFTLDARSLTQIGGTALSYALGTIQVQAFLRLFAENPYLPASADEILHVMRIKENRSHYAIVCQVRRPNGHMVRKTQLLIKGLEEEQVLLRLLECRMGWNGTLEAAENRKPLCILLSVLICAVCTALCVLSHPAVAQLPRQLYFPCLGGAFAALCAAICCAVRQRRGE